MQGTRNGTLTDDRYGFYIMQNYGYLLAYAQTID